MISIVTKHMGAALLGVAVIASCSRPVAYFQRSPSSVELSAIHPTQALPIATPVETVTVPSEPLTQANATMNQLEAFVRNDSKLAINKKLSKRMDRVKRLLASTPETLEPTATYVPHKMNVAERLILRKINKRIGPQLAPNHPEKAMVANRVQLIGGIVLLIGGLLLLILGTGTGAFIGLIVALIGALGLILGLFGG